VLSNFNGLFPYGLLAADAAGLISEINPQLEEMLGYSAAEVTGKYSVCQLLDQHELAERVSDLSRLLGKSVSGAEAVLTIADLEGIERRQWTLLDKGNRPIPAILHVVAAESGDDQPRRFMICVTPCADNEIRGFNSTGIGRPGEEFFFGMFSHVREKLNSMLVLASLLKEDEDPERRVSFIDGLLDEGSRLEASLRHYGELSKMLNGDFPAENHPVNLSDLVDELAPDLQHKGALRNIRITCDVHTVPAALIRIDSNRLGRLMDELVGLSLACGCGGFVNLQLRADLYSEDVSRCRLVIRLLDSGVPETPETRRPYRQLHMRYLHVFAEALGGNLTWSNPQEFLRTRLRCEISVPNLQILR